MREVHIFIMSFIMERKWIFKTNKSKRTTTTVLLISTLVSVMVFLTACNRDFSSVDWNKATFEEKEFTFGGWDDEGMVLLDEAGHRSFLKYIDVLMIPLQSPLYDDLEKDEKLLVDCAVKEKIFDRKSGQMTYATRYGILRRANGKAFHYAEPKTLELIYRGIKEEGISFRRYGNGITAYYSPQEKDRSECLKDSVIYENGVIPSGGLNRFEACEILLFEQSDGKMLELFFVDNNLRLLNFNRETQSFDSYCTPDEMIPGTRVKLSVSDNLFRNGEWVYTVVRVVPVVQN